MRNPLGSNVVFLVYSASPDAFGKGFWGLLMLIGPVGSLIYFLAVYLRYRPSIGKQEIAASAGE